ncbi:hypothetical protein [Streptomyces sp. NPDC047097]|uniref:hypothetical protein n=1 Tax=Streptomyces sp. NPDC047097 TaxID=3155260 RepID=UPI00340401CC
MGEPPARVRLLAADRGFGALVWSGVPNAVGTGPMVALAGAGAALGVAGTAAAALWLPMAVPAGMLLTAVPPALLWWRLRQRRPDGPRRRLHCFERGLVYVDPPAGKVYAHPWREVRLTVRATTVASDYTGVPTRLRSLDVWAEGAGRLFSVGGGELWTVVTDRVTEAGPGGTL